MAGRTNYRIKLDLSKYYHDARRFSWIYVNSTNIWFVSHLKRHIKDIFDIEEPFHLLLNGNEYLPPAEDVRVLEENEIIVVERGSGMGHGSTNGGTSTMSLPVSDMENGFVKSTSTTDKEDPYVRERKPLDGVQLLNGAVDADATRYHSIIADVMATESSSDCKRNDDASVDSSILDAYGVAAAPPPHKRKRIRRKKAKQTEERAQSPVLGGSSARREQTNHEKPKVIGSYALPSGTHIRFDNPDEGDNKTDSGTRGNSEKSVAPLFKSPRADGLSRLLALGNCSSPLTFANKRPKYENGSSIEQSSTAVTTGSPDEPTNGQERDEYADLKPQEFPSLESSTEIGDVIAFKVLRIGSEYTPEVSDYIVAKTLARCPENTLYTFKILKGQSEIEGPSGKFSLPENEAQIAESDTVELNFSQLIEPRLIGRTQVPR